jgi:hypothetical protein
MSTSATDLNKQGHPNSTTRDLEAGKLLSLPAAKLLVLEHHPVVLGTRHQTRSDYALGLDVRGGGTSRARGVKLRPAGYPSEQSGCAPGVRRPAGVQFHIMTLAPLVWITWK